MSNAAYTDLLAHVKETTALGQCAGLLGWDREVMMPPNGLAQRAEQAAALTRVIHARRTDARLEEWLAAIDAEALDPTGQANLREIARGYHRARCIPADLAAEKARATATGQQSWAAARASEDIASFLPALERLVAIAREEAAYLRTDGETLYSALLEEYEPGTSENEVAATFAALRPGLVDLRTRVLAKPGPERLGGEFAPEAQLELAQRLAGDLGYDWGSGRLDLTTHPFASGTRGDARITTRVDPSDPFNCLYSTVHETGHALYEQGLDPALEWQPAGHSASLGVHESQSRLIENQIGRSRAYAEYLHPLMADRFGDYGCADADALWRTINRVSPGFIRTEADEIHYNLHIMLRFDIERALIAGDLEPADLEAAWNDRFAADFGQPVDRPSNGILQDVHWSAGLFGYFPTYALGNIYAGCLWGAIQRDFGDTDSMVSRGEIGPIRDWLRERVHRRGSILMPRALIEEATGAAPDETALLGYLEAKFGELYAL